MKISEIKNSKLLLDHFGYWTNFHDSEIIEMSFHRNYPDEPIIKVKIYAFEMSDKVVGKYYKLIKHCIIDFEFSGVQENSFEGFNFQNAMDGLVIGKAEGLFKVEFGDVHGVDGYLNWKNIEIENLKFGEVLSANFVLD